MSSIAKLLQEKRAEFISLHELLETIVEQNNCTLGQAAEFLQFTLHEGEESSPLWYTSTPCLKLANGIDVINMNEMLEHVAISGEYQEEIPF